MASNNYWCKFCSTYVRDTKFEKQQHEATARHKGSVQRALRTIHRDHERGERDKARAKSEVARLNGLVSGKTQPEDTATNTVSRPAKSKPAAPQQANLQDRKRQMAQLAAMGVAVPEEFRGEMAMAGEWEVSRVLQSRREGSHDEQGESGDAKKRKLEEDDDGGLDDFPVRRDWGRTTREYPTDTAAVADFDAILAGSGGIVKKESSMHGVVKTEVKKEEEEVKPSVDLKGLVKQENNETTTSAPVVFKKRKPKVMKS